MKFFALITLGLTLLIVPAHADQGHGESIDTVQASLFRTNNPEPVTIKIGDMIGFDLACDTFNELYNLTLANSCFYAKKYQPVFWGKVTKIERVPYALRFTVDISLNDREGATQSQITEISRIFYHISK